VLPDCPGELEVPGFAQAPRVDTGLFVEAGFGLPEPPLDRPTVEPEASVLEPLPVAPLSVELLQPPSSQPTAAAIRSIFFMTQFIGFSRRHVFQAPKRTRPGITPCTSVPRSAQSAWSKPSLR
jgi:hypothetical protein